MLVFHSLNLLVWSIKLNNDYYLKLGVSSTKEDVKAAIKSQSKGLFPGSFCKVIESPDGNPEKCCIIHADGAGTKSNLAYLYYKETGKTDWFTGIATDSITMNIDDMVCAGALDQFVVSNTIGRNAARINGEIIKKIIAGYSDFASKMSKYGITITLGGGETADVGDVVSTMIVDSTVLVLMNRNQVIDNDNIQPGQVIVGFASNGQSNYEDQENSGIGSNGLTAARHMLLHASYGTQFPETVSSTSKIEDIYQGKFKLSDPLPGSSQTVGEAILSPTRTYLPIVRHILAANLPIHGAIHCTGGGQAKNISFGQGVHYIKDNLFPMPPIFEALKKSGKMSTQELYKVFNMGHRLELYTDPTSAQKMIEISQSFGVNAQIVGRVEKSSTLENQVTISTSEGPVTY